MSEQSAEKDVTCRGNGGSVVTVEGPQFGPQTIEEPCPLCGEWHASPAEREAERRYQAWLANPGLIRRAWRRLRLTTPPGETPC